MLYPEPLKKGSRIAITAFSTGIAQRHEKRFNEIMRTLRNRGYEVVVGDCLKGEYKHVSAPKEQRASELMKFLTDDSIDAVAPPWGGELAIEILPLLNFDLISKSKPKWLFGFSDVSTIAASINSIIGWVTVHSSNLMDLIDTNTDPLTSNTLNYLEVNLGGVVEQVASDRNTRNWPKIESDPLASIVCDENTEWKWLNKPNNSEFISGRIIGGCWDIFIYLFGTPYLSLSGMNSKYKEGVILYLENAEMMPCDLVRAIHSMEFHGVFEAINGLVIGRNFAVDSNNDSDLTYFEVLTDNLGSKNIPVIYDVDIGHVPPNLTIFNGSYAEIGIFNGKGVLTQWLK